jgi:septum formation protein
MSTERLILASASPRRRELLATVYADFDVAPCPFAEPELKSAKASPGQWAEALAYFKARAVAETHPGCWVLAADTIVVCDGRVLGKPRDSADARAMLELQARQVSDVLTGVCLLRRGAGDNEERFSQVEQTRVWMRDDLAVREAYLASGDWQAKAGAYGIQNVGDRLVERIEGSFSNVVGLPLETVTRMLRHVGLPVQSEPNARGGPPLSFRGDRRSATDERGI